MQKLTYIFRSNRIFRYKSSLSAQWAVALLDASYVPLAWRSTSLLSYFDLVESCLCYNCC